MPEIHEGNHGADSPSQSEAAPADAAENPAPRSSGAPNLAVAVSWYADVTLNRFAYVSPMAVRLLGYPASAWKEDGFWAAHLPADERETVQAQRKRHVAAGQDFELNYHMIASDGTLVRIRELTTVTEVADGSHVLRFEEALPLVECDKVSEEIRRNTRAYNAMLEILVLRHPEQWFWVHRRWKLAPAPAP